MNLLYSALKTLFIYMLTYCANYIIFMLDLF